MTNQSMTERVATIGSTNVTGTFYRHAARGREAFAGGPDGRWGATFPVIYLGRPRPSIIVEAYRHLVEDAGVPAHLVKARTEYTVPVAVTRILDLRDPEHLDAVNLTDADIRSDVNEYDACQAVAAAAHQLRFHGILAPAATGLGETLALFRERLPASELPIPAAERAWDQLPADPRSLRNAASS